MAGKGSDKSPLILAKTHLMVVGFYLLTLGILGVALPLGGEAADAKTAIEILSVKIGGMVFAIGFLHFVMVGAFASARKNKNAFRGRVEYAKPVISHIDE